MEAPAAARPTRIAVATSPRRRRRSEASQAAERDAVATGRTGLAMGSSTLITVVTRSAVFGMRVHQVAVGALAVHPAVDRPARRGRRRQATPGCWSRRWWCDRPAVPQPPDAVGDGLFGDGVDGRGRDRAAPRRRGRRPVPLPESTVGVARRRGSRHVRPPGAPGRRDGGRRRPPRRTPRARCAPSAHRAHCRARTPSGSIPACR